MQWLFGPVANSHTPRPAATTLKRGKQPKTTSLLHLKPNPGPFTAISADINLSTAFKHARTEGPVKGAGPYLREGFGV